MFFWKANHQLFSQLLRKADKEDIAELRKLIIENTAATHQKITQYIDTLNTIVVDVHDARINNLDKKVRELRQDALSTEDKLL